MPLVRVADIGHVPTAIFDVPDATGNIVAQTYAYEASLQFFPEWCVATLTIDFRITPKGGGSAFTDRGKIDGLRVKLVNQTDWSDVLAEAPLGTTLYWTCDAPTPRYQTTTCFQLSQDAFDKFRPATARVAYFKFDASAGVTLGTCP